MLLDGLATLCRLISRPVSALNGFLYLLFREPEHWETPFPPQPKVAMWKKHRWRNSCQRMRGCCSCLVVYVVLCFCSVCILCHLVLSLLFWPFIAFAVWFIYSCCVTCSCHLFMIGALSAWYARSHAVGTLIVSCFFVDVWFICKDTIYSGFCCCVVFFFVWSLSYMTVWKHPMRYPQRLSWCWCQYDWHCFLSVWCLCCG